MALNIYKTKTRTALDSERGVVVVAGTGMIRTNSQKVGFSFSAIFQDNNDGTIYARYDASNPDASFIILATPGTLTISNK